MYRNWLVAANPLFQLTMNYFQRNEKQNSSKDVWFHRLYFECRLQTSVVLLWLTSSYSKQSIQQNPSLRMNKATNLLAIKRDAVVEWLNYFRLDLPRGPFTNMVLTAITWWTRNQMPSKVWNEITHPFPNFNCLALEVLEWGMKVISPHTL